jgi:hypothetical protein
MSRQTTVACLAAVAALAFPATAPAARGGNGSATITGAFADACRDFTARSSKDISYVQMGYADGRVVKDESISSPAYALDGGPGQEIASASVKSARTVETFTCTPASGPPAARLEILTPDDTGCALFFESGLLCSQHAARSVWRSTAGLPTEPAPPDGSTKEAGHLLWGCDRTTGPCSSTFELRGTSSTGDLASWSLHFGDGSTAAGSWTGEPPAAVAHTYDPPGAPCVADPYCVVTLIVTDAAGRTDEDAITMAFIDQTPD